MKKASSLKQGSNPGDRRRDRDPSGTVGRNLEAFLLLELLRAPSYGYELIRTLGSVGFKRAGEPGVVYKVLRALEESGAIRSRWSTRVSGPARRYYQLTQKGRELLKHRVFHLQRQLRRTQRLLENYAALTGETLDGDQGESVLEKTEPLRIAAGRRRKSS